MTLFGFLEQEGILELYMKHYVKTIILKPKVVTEVPILSLFHIFQWKGTEEGYSYWDKMEDKYYDQLSLTQNE